MKNVGLWPSNWRYKEPTNGKLHEIYTIPTETRTHLFHGAGGSEVLAPVSMSHLFIHLKRCA